jgi:hypothetical protein
MAWQPATLNLGEKIWGPYSCRDESSCPTLRAFAVLSEYRKLLSECWKLDVSDGGVDVEI